MELRHHGIKGQKWGVRRFQNEDGTLTSEGRKRSTQYKKMMAKVNKDLSSKEREISLRAYNNTADKFNKGLVKKYNDDWKKKHGNDYNDQDYIDSYNKYFSKMVAQEYDVVKRDAMRSSKSYGKAVEFAKKHEMDSWDDLAKQNAKFVSALDAQIKKYNDDIDD